jgi:hypothetical protein
MRVTGRGDARGRGHWVWHTQTLFRMLTTRVSTSHSSRPDWGRGTRASTAVEPWLPWQGHELARGVEPAADGLRIR